MAQVGSVRVGYRLLGELSVRVGRDQSIIRISRRFGEVIGMKYFVRLVG